MMAIKEQTMLNCVEALASIHLRQGIGCEDTHSEVYPLVQVPEKIV